MPVVDSSTTGPSNGAFALNNEIENGNWSEEQSGSEGSCISDAQSAFPKLYNTEVRHGFNTISQEWMAELAESYYTYFCDKRHESQGRANDKDVIDPGNWRVSNRRRTVNAALVLCLNLGVDPPDVIKTQPTARVESWVDPNQYVDNKKALEQIGKNLQSQYESLSARVKYKQSLDPNIDDIKRFCVSLRRSARDDRILFHYNGHGVPRPTSSGEIWVFNRAYTQYIPLSVYELQTWLGAPVIYCYDCSGAGNIVNSFNNFVKKRQQLEVENDSANKNAPKYAFETCIQLGSCEADEILPMNPLLPADLFTCCITTPVDIAVKWFLIQNSRGFTSSGLDPNNIKIPGKISDRRTPLGELNWIFTAITDTIAWSALPSTLFKKLFRQDLIVAAMFRNFLMASRIMRAHNCHPVSSPSLPDTCGHALWDSWDAAINHCLLQVATPNPGTDERLFNDFFEQQLTAFEMWLNYQSGDVHEAPEQLPILLQVLLSHIHRLRALSLLCRYLDLGPQAVKTALNIEFFIYVLKLLQSPAPELKPVLVFIWARIMAIDQQVQTELVKNNVYQYFVNVLTESESTFSPSELKSGDPAMCCFVLAQFARGYNTAQQILVSNSELLDVVERKMESESPLLRQWAILLLAELVPLRSVPAILKRLRDPIPEVRAAVLYCLSTYVSQGILEDSDADMVGKAAVSIALDGSPLVRSEFSIFLCQYIIRYRAKFLVCAFTTLEEEYASSKYDGDLRSQSPAHGTVCLALWRCLLVLTNDAMQYVKDAAVKLVDFIQENLAKTQLSDEVRQMSDALLNSADLFKQIDQPYRKTDTNGHTYSKNSLPQSNSHGNPRLAQENLEALSLTHDNNVSSSPSKSALQTAMDWVVGYGTRGSPTENDQSQRVRLRSSLASLIPSFKNVEANSETANLSCDSTSQQLSEVMEASIPPPPISSNVDTSISTDGEGLVLKSEFREFCVEIFREPQMKLEEADVAGSKEFFEKQWRKARNEKIMAETQVQKGLSVTGSWGNQISNLQGIGDSAQKLCFAQFEPHLLAADSTSVAVFDWERGKLVNRFVGGRNLAGIQFLNEDDTPLALTASRDGMARVYKNYSDPYSCHIVTSWWLFADLVHHQPHNPVVLVDWQQSRGHLLVGGDARVVRVWDASREQAISDIPVRTSLQLTALTSDKVAGNLFLTGFSDGAIHLYDLRMDKSNALVRRWKPQTRINNSNHKGHSTKISNLKMQRGGTREVVSGSADGSVCLWDMRSTEAVGAFQAHTKEMNCMDLHEHAPVIGTASRFAGIWTTSGRRVSTLKGPSSSYLSSKASPVAALNFHPHQMVVAMSNANEPAVSVFRCIS